jgi:hypothetical protein
MNHDVAPITLAAEDAIELAELLEFLHDMLEYSPGAILDARLHRLTGGAYTLDELRADLARFAFLLGGSGELFLNGGQPR